MTAAPTADRPSPRTAPRTGLALACSMAIALAAAASPGRAQIDEEAGRQVVLRKLRANKLDSKAFNQVDWATDLASARERATAEEKLIFAYFTRSDAECTPCEVMENGALSQTSFTELAEVVVPFVHVTSGLDDDPEPDLLRRMGFERYPSIALLDASGQIVARVRGRTVPVFRQSLERAREYMELRARAAQDPTLIPELFLFQLSELRLYRFAEAAELAAKVELNDEQRERVDTHLFNLEFAELHERAQEDPEGAVARFREMGKAEALLNRPMTYWQSAVRVADAALDADLYSDAIEGIKSLINEDERRWSAYVKGLETRLIELRAAEKQRDAK